MKDYTNMFKMKNHTNILIPMGGLGSRFAAEGFTLPKPLIMANGKTLIEHSVGTLGLKGRFIFVTRRYDSLEHNQLLSTLLKKIAPGCVEICVDKPTRGAVETCLIAREYIDNEAPLIITNCDQITDWCPDDFLEFVSKGRLDGAVVTYTSDNPKNSFAVLNSGNSIVKIVEKEAVSNVALVGIHYWRQGRMFVESALQLLNDFESFGRPECYISETYNYLLAKELMIKNYHLDDNHYISLGTPYDLSIYLAKVKEFQTDKPKTIFCDIDGTILHHVHRHSDVVSVPPKLLKGVLAKFDQWDSQGHKIVLCTSRKEAAREITEKQLKSLGLTWDYLLMGLTSGVRVLINDKLHQNDPDRALAINLTTNGGFEKAKWDDYGL